MLEKIYIARHGFRLSWETSVWNAPTGTPRDPPLSAHGVDQAKELATFFKDTTSPSSIQRPQRIYSSPLYRCLQTATPIAEALQLPIHVEHGLAEWYLPARRGLHPRSLPASELKEWIPLVSSTQSDTSLLYPSQKGETISELHTRAKQILTLLINKINAELDPPKCVLILSHAATLIALGRSLLGEDEENGRDIRAATCSVSEYDLVEGSSGERGGLGRWKSSRLGDTSMLKNGEERHWDFSFVEAYEEDGVLEDGTDEPLESDKYKPTDAKTTNSTESGNPTSTTTGTGKL